MHSVFDDAKDILEKVSDDCEDIFEKVSNDAKDILEKVLDGFESLQISTFWRGQ